MVSLRKLSSVLIGFTLACAPKARESVETPPDAGAPPVVSLDRIEVEQGVDLTSDGRTALLQNLDLVGSVYLYDVETKTLEKKTESGNWERPVFALSGNGQRVVGIHGDPFQAGIWSEQEGWVDLGNPYPYGCDVNQSSGWDLSADGHVAVGLAWNGCKTEAFLWSDASGSGEFKMLDVLGDGSAERASVVSSDGRVIAGFASSQMADRTPAIWHDDGSGFALDPEMEVIGEVLSISADGSMVAGTWNRDGFYWTQETGVVNFGKFSDALETDTTYPNAIAAGGKLIFGGCGDAWGGGVRAFVWTKDTGMRLLEEIVVANGLTVPDGYQLANVRAASTDGSVVLGTLTNERMQQVSFLLRLPVSAYGI